MVINIQRWSPIHICDCVIEQTTDTNEPTAEPKFLLVNKVCSRHSKLASKKHQAKHFDNSKHVINIIEATKADNFNRSANKIMQTPDGTEEKQMLIQNHASILQHNEKITKEWNNLVKQPHAFDSQIYEAIIKEDQAFKTKSNKKG